MEKRLKRTLMMMLLAMFPLLVPAQLANGTYYLYNVGAGLYLDHGGATNYNVCLKPHGAPFVVSNVSGETYSFKASVDKTAYLDAKATVYSTTSPVAFTVTKLSDGNYTLSDGTNFLGYNGTINSVLSQTTATFSYSADAGSKIEWRFIPKDTLLARLAYATQDNPVDATFYIKEPNFNRHGANLSAWSNYKTGQNSNYLCNNCGWNYNAAVTVSQKLTGLLPGAYELKAQAFYCHGAYGMVGSNYTAENMPNYCFIFADTNRVNVEGILKETLATNIYTKGQSTTYGYIPTMTTSNTNDLVEALDHGMYKDNTVYASVGDDGTLNIGVTISELTASSWMAYDNFELYYLGTAASIEKTQYEQSLETIGALSNLSTGIDTYRTAKIAAAKALLDGTKAGYQAASALLTAAIDTMNATIAAYGVAKKDFSRYSLGICDAADAAYTTQATKLKAAATQAANDLENAQTATAIDKALADMSAAYMAFLEIAMPVAGKYFDLSAFIVNPSFEDGMSGWSYTALSGDVGAKANTDNIYTTTGTDGHYLFNTFYSSTSYVGSTQNQFVRQTISGLPAGQYRVLALVTSGENTTQMQIFADDSCAQFLDTNKTIFVEQGLGFCVFPYKNDVTIGLRSASWFKADNFRLYYYGKTDAYNTELTDREANVAFDPFLVASQDGSSSTGWTYTEVGGHTHGGFPIATTKTGDETGVDSSVLQIWTGTTYQLGPSNTTYTYTNLPTGYYKVSALIRVYDENGDYDGTAAGLSLTANDISKNIVKGATMTQGTDAGKGFYGTYDVITRVESDGLLKLAISLNGTSFNWVSWSNVRVAYFGSASPYPAMGLTKLNAYEAVASQATDRKDYDTVLSKAKGQLASSTNENDIDKVTATVRKALLTLIQKSPAKSGQYDITSFVTDPDFTSSVTGTQGALFDGTGYRQIASTTDATVMGKKLANMPVGDYTLKVQAFYRPASNDVTLKRHEAGIIDNNARFYMNVDTVTLENIVADARYTTKSINEIYSTVNGLGFPTSSATATEAFDAGRYWNIVHSYLNTEGDLDIGFSISATSLNDNWLAFDNLRLYYGSIVPVVTITPATPYTVTEDMVVSVDLKKNMAAGALTPLCLPFDFSGGNFGQLYAIAGVNSNVTTIYPVTTVKAGQPCVMKAYDDVSNISMSNVKLKAVRPEACPLAWGEGYMKGSYADYSWSYINLKGVVKQGSSLTFHLADLKNMDFTVDLENMAASRFVNNNTYTTEASSVIDDYNLTPPARRDIPNPVAIPLPANKSTKVTIKYGMNEDLSNAMEQSIAADATMGYISNLIPQKTYYYCVTADNNIVSKGRFVTTGHLRMIYAPSASNIRDLGGWPTVDGLRVNYGHLYRGSELNGVHVASAADIAALKSLGIGAEIDFRFAGENEGVGISAYGFDKDAGTYYYANANDYLASDVAVAATQHRFADEFRLICNNLRMGNAVYFHCVWGADRTGLFTLLCEGLLGVKLDAIYKDYELTSFSPAGTRVKGSIQERLAAFSTETISDTNVKSVFEDYFINKMGVAKEDIDFFRNIMLQPNEEVQAEDLALLKTAIASAETHPLGFRSGEYAPYTNAATLENLAAARKVLAAPTSKIVVNSTTSALNAAVWTINVQEMNAVYNGNFSLSADCSELKAWNNADINGTSYLTGIGSGYSRAFAASTWQNYFYAFNQTESSFGTRTAAYIIFKDNAGKSARTSVFRYGQIQGYTMPLKNGTTYRLLYDAAPWGTSNEAVIMGIADATGNVLATDTLTLTNDIYTSDAIANKVVANHGELIFTPKVDGDYTLTMASGDTRKDFNIAVSNISIFSISTSITYTVPEKGHGTIMLPFAASLPEGWKAYSCRSTEGVAVVLSDPTETLEACTPYIIEAKGGDQHTFTGLYASTHTTATDGLLTGTLDAFTVPQGSYALQTQNGLFGFYRTTTDPIVTPSYSAFLTPTGTDAADRLFFMADIPTGIDIVTNSNAIVNIYCPDGRLASRSTTLKKALSTLKPGIYISGGHKIIVK